MLRIQGVKNLGRYNHRKEWPHQSQTQQNLRPKPLNRKMEFDIDQMCYSREM